MPLPSQKDPKMAALAASTIFFRTFISGAFFVVLVIFCVLSISLGALWKAPARNLPGWIVVHVLVLPLHNHSCLRTLPILSLAKPSHSLAGFLLPWTIVSTIARATRAIFCRQIESFNYNIVTSFQETCVFSYQNHMFTERSM
jgi:hypothetical protein